MNKGQLIDAVAERTGQHKGAVDSVLDALRDVIHEELKAGGEVMLPGWESGIFEIKRNILVK